MAHLFLFLLFCLLADSAQCEGWVPTLVPGPTLPPVLIAVDKEHQHVRVVLHDRETRSMWTRLELPCTTGRRAGDKENEGDLKTPEGIYFIQYAARDGLDHAMFGAAAYPLNYPNPVDRIQGKTGSGILIHGRNREVGPLQTLGCVVLENAELARLAPHLGTQTTPVVIGAGITVKKQGPPHQADDMLALTWRWVTALERRNQRLFDLYDTATFAKGTGEPFAAYRARLNAEFIRRRWADIRFSDLCIYDGPGYLITAFTQRTYPDGGYGQRRLYWMHRGEGWKIVGEEWVPRPQPGTDYLALVDGEIRARLHVCREAWDQGDVRTVIGAYDQAVIREGESGREAVERAVAREINTGRPNPFDGEPVLRVGERGLEVILPGRTLVLMPTFFNKWLIVSEQVRP